MLEEQTQMTTSQFMTPKELSERWNGRINVRTLANWRSNGTGPKFVKVGGAVLYRKSDIDAYENNSTATSTSQYGASQYTTGA